MSSDRARSLLQQAVLIIGNSGPLYTLLEYISGSSFVGATGPTGPTGTNGVSATTTLSAGFVQPAVGANVQITVGTTAWMVATEVLYVAVAGYMQIVSVDSGALVTVQNLGYAGNAAPAAPVAIGGRVTPGGLRGPTGATGATGATGFSGLLWLTNEQIGDGTDGTLSGGTVAADRTTGQIYFAARDVTVTAIRFYWQTTGAPVTVAANLYVKTSAVPVASINVNVNASGIYNGIFASPYTVTGADTPGFVYASVYFNAAYTRGTLVGTGGMPSPPFPVGPGMTLVGSASDAGNVKPTTIGGEFYPVDLITS